MPDPTNKFIKAKQPQKEDTTLSDNLRMVLEKHYNHNDHIHFSCLNIFFF